MIRDLLGRDLSRDLDRYVTGNYGERQYKEGNVQESTKARKPHQGSPHYNQQHPAVALSGCPVCARPVGLPCIRTVLSAHYGEPCETHVSRVKVAAAMQPDPSLV